MRKFALVGLTVLVACALVGCGGVTKEKAEKVYKDYYTMVLKDMKDGKSGNSTEYMNKAAAANGFKDWTDFATKAAKSLGADGWTKVTAEITKWMETETKKVTDEMTKKAMAGAGGEKKEEPEPKKE